MFISILLALLNTIYQHISFFIKTTAETINPYATLILAMLTAIYIILTMNIVREARKQTDVLIESSRHVQRAYIDAAIDKLTFKNLRFPRKYPIGKLNGIVKFSLRNIGKTPAFVIFYMVHIDSLSFAQLDLHDSVICAKIKTKKPIEEFPLTFDPEHEHRFGLHFDGLLTTNQGNIYAHLYILYEDVFKKYHGFYSVTQWVIDTAREDYFEYPSITRRHIFSDEELDRIEPLFPRFDETSVVRSMTFK